MNSAELTSHMLTLSKKLSLANDNAVAEVRKWAQAEHDYRKARAQAWVRVPDGMTARQKEDWVNAETADLRYARDLADGLTRAARDDVNNKRSQLSALQTVGRLAQAEAEFARTGGGT